MNNMRTIFSWFALFILLLSSCRGVSETSVITSCRYAEYFDVCIVDTASLSTRAVIVSPYDGSTDTLEFAGPLRNIICMSSSHVACLSAIGAQDCISGVSGLGFLTDEKVREHAFDVGYDNSLDYERILQQRPDLVVAYTVSSSVPQYVAKLESLGVPVVVLYDHLEAHPLARAEYVRLFGALTGKVSQADSVHDAACARYEVLAEEATADGVKKQVFLNIPYSDAWYIPGKDSYMSRLIQDAGGEVIGAGSGVTSRLISLEDAYLMSQKADLWLNPGYCRTREQLSDIHQLFPSFGPLKSGRPI